MSGMCRTTTRARGVLVEAVVLSSLCLVVAGLKDDQMPSDRFAVYWNRSNPRFDDGGYAVEVSINDYLDIYCPHYPRSPAPHPERYVLFMVDYDSYVACHHDNTAIKRWECNRPLAPGGALKFSEKFQMFTPFSLGFEFRPGHQYYYVSSSVSGLSVQRRRGPDPPDPPPPCLRLRIYVKPSNESESYLTDESRGGRGTPPCTSSLLLLLLLLLLLILTS